ncbi:hypothetical protein KCU81_g7367, partial [Aureobasidium melanogenum]
MSTPESTILGLRTQIFGHTNVVILTTRERECRSVNMYRFEAIIANDISMGTRVFVKASSLGSHEAALRLLLDITSDMMKEVLEGQSAELLDVKHLSPDTSIAQNSTAKPVQNTSRPVQNTSKPVQDTNKPVKQHGLRTQILENWTFLRPDQSKPVIIISGISDFEAIIAGNNFRGKIYKVSRRRASVEEALRVLLYATSESIYSALNGRRNGFGCLPLS